MKKILTISTMMTLSVAFATDPLSAGGPYKETVDGIEWTFMVKGSEAHVGTGKYGDSAISFRTVGDVSVPEILGGRLVACVSDSAFCGCNLLKSVVIPSGVTSIGNYGFYGPSFKSVGSQSRMVLKDVALIAA